MFDKKSARVVSDQLIERWEKNKSQDVGIHISVSPRSEESNVYETFRLAKEAALLLPTALDRIEELEKALTEERANQLVNGTECCVVPDEALPDGGLQECYCVDEPKKCRGYEYLKTVAREQLQKEGTL